MKRVRCIWKTLLVFLAALMIPLILAGCGKGEEKPAGEHSSETEHPSEEKSAEEHPSAEHPE